MEGMSYSQLVQDVLKRHTTKGLSRGETDLQLIFDTERDRYQLLHIGWDGSKRVFGCIIYVTLQDGKIWIERDGTELGIATELLALGVPKTDIVLGFQSPYRRRLTDFAAG